MTQIIEEIIKKDETDRKIKFSKDEILNTHTEELVIALCGTIGSPLHEVASVLEEKIKEKFSYDCKIIRLSKYIEKHSNVEINDSQGFDRINSLINGGNKLREDYGSSILSEFAVFDIASYRQPRQKKTKDGTINPSLRVCHIIDSIKNIEELNLLRLIYNDIFYCIGISSPIDYREKRLSVKMNLGEVYKLIERDTGEEFNHGQRVEDTFHQADYFINIDTLQEKKLKEKIDRFLKLIFSSEILTPSNHETAMYMAVSAACNSACLSRQVGAAIVDKEGTLLSVGWNDVPSFGGTLYNDNSEKDGRCMNWDKGKCNREFHKDNLVKDLIKDLLQNNYIYNNNLEEVKKIINNSKFTNLIDYSRAIHAEMHAIIVGSQIAGNKMKGGKLYCTTYPCHNCARHIVFAGLKEVYYIEPYRKSQAVNFHEDSITEKVDCDDKVKILPYEGIASNLYKRLYGMGSKKRKKAGKRTNEDPSITKPKRSISMESFPVLESVVVRRLGEIFSLGDKDEE